LGVVQFEVAPDKRGFLIFQAILTGDSFHCKSMRRACFSGCPSCYWFILTLTDMLLLILFKFRYGWRCSFRRRGQNTLVTVCNVIHEHGAVFMVQIRFCDRCLRGKRVCSSSNNELPPLIVVSLRVLVVQIAVVF
jgi:hypothetical protein